MSIATAVDRLHRLGLRDRWGYPLTDGAILRLVAWLDANPGADADALAIAMFTGDLPMVCEDYDTPADDELLEEILRTARERR